MSKNQAAAVQQQPAPEHNDGPSAHDLVIEDIKLRKEFGLRKYGTILQPFNGRDQLTDAYQEVLDLIVYLRLLILEDHDRKLKEPTLPWLEPPLDQWDIVGMNHYTVSQERKHLFVAMSKDGKLIKAEGQNQTYLFKSLAEQAREIERLEKNDG